MLLRSPLPKWHIAGIVSEWTWSNKSTIHLGSWFPGCPPIVHCRSTQVTNQIERHTYREGSALCNCSSILWVPEGWARIFAPVEMITGLNDNRNYFRINCFRLCHIFFRNLCSYVVCVEENLTILNDRRNWRNIGLDLNRQRWCSTIRNGSLHVHSCLENKYFIVAVD